MKALALLPLIVLLAACQQTNPAGAPELQLNLPSPQQGGVALHPLLEGNPQHDPHAAFEQQAAAYSKEQQPAPAVSIAPSPSPTIQLEPAPAAAPALTPAPATVPALTPAPPAPQFLEQPSSDANSGTMDYKVKITNGTPSRLFLEAQDAQGSIYPCGFMQKGQSFTTPMSKAAPIQGPILVVVRDPDQPGAPELRRYRIAPPRSSYANGTVEITIIPKGRYEAAVNGQLYYRSEAEE